jgi:hypothetical protein
MVLAGQNMAKTMKIKALTLNNGLTNEARGGKSRERPVKPNLTL